MLTRMDHRLDIGDALAEGFSDCAEDRGQIHDSTKAL